MVEEIELPKPILIEDLGMLYATEKSKERKRFGLYECGFCGNNFKAIMHKIKSGNTKSCGCYKRKSILERNTTHGLRNTRIYRIWRCIKSRTLNSKYGRYPYYGGRGITICDEWKNDFKSFYDWAMSNDYSDELSVDRIDNDGNYEPNNCRWTTQSVQCRNRRMSKKNRSGYRGVHFDKKLGKYIAQICVNKNTIYIGLYLNVIEGAIAYNNYIIENNLEGFILNEIPDKNSTND